MNILLVDDEQPARHRLASLIEELGADYEVVGEAENGAKAVSCCLKNQIDLVFLDIRMPVMDGMDTARELSKLDRQPVIIFVTAYDEHALQAFESNALDYLLKPIRKNRLQRALQKAQVFSRARWDSLQKTSLLNGNARSHICIHERGDIRLVPVTEIRYLLADQKYTVLRSADREDLLDESLKTFEREFSSLFVRVHRNALVAISHIQGLQKDSDKHLRVMLDGIPESIEVSRRHVASVRSIIRGLKSPRTDF